MPTIFGKSKISVADEYITDAPDSLQEPSATNKAAGTQHFDRVAHYGTVGEVTQQRTQQWRKSFAARVLALFLYISNIFFLVFGLGLIVLGIWVGQKADQRILGAVNDHLALATALTGAGLVLFAFLGFFTARTYNRALLCLYVVLLLVLVLFVLAMAIAIPVVLGNDMLQNWGRDAWSDAASGNSTAELCQLQRDFMCSGFTSNCSKAMPSMWPKDCPHCKDPKVSRYPEPCWTKLKNEIRHNVGLALGATLGLLALVVLTLIAACCLTRRVRVSSSERELHETLKWTSFSAPN
eukprot:NODE_613_length_1265_cov_291.984375_g441_i0.p1 GENE.NODE_613_length_1265_cov_291.984375_g441_i0~~NODE_613_length_1265_cov_291.984375_g441_i0.p1  ORF type:complete len:295 (-),score=96.64 NODE_613_length_1265_cov_291.984375_g441_i0:268-1152(-)